MNTTKKYSKILSIRYEYMAQYSYNINELSEEMKQAIIADRKEFNNI